MYGNTVEAAGLMPRAPAENNIKENLLSIPEPDDGGDEGSCRGVLNTCPGERAI